MKLPRIAITIGDPAGIGPEIVAKAVASERVYKVCRPVVIGDKRLITQFAPLKKACAFVHVPLQNIRALKPGSFSVATGRASYEAICRAVELAMKKDADGIVTAPISKAALNIAGFHYPGHTELLAALSGSKNYAMLMFAGYLRAAMVTRHIPVSETGKRISKDAIVKVALLAHAFLKEKENLDAPALGICALNPHAGEGGLLGKEEGSVILPAVEALKERGIDAEGPLPIDSAWMKLKEKKYDLLVTMYHDQAMIGLKCLLPEKIVNITAGLPFVRTSPGHGTGFDIAGKNRADARPMIEAILTAARLSR